MVLYANTFDTNVSFDFIQITIVHISISHCRPFRWYSVLYHTYSNKLRDSDNGNRSTGEGVREGKRTRRAKKREWKRMVGVSESDRVRENERENGICTGSQPNPTSSKCRKDDSRRVKATRSECHPLRNCPCEIRSGWRGSAAALLIFFYVAVRRIGQGYDKCEANAEVIAHARVVHSTLRSS